MITTLNELPNELLIVILENLRPRDRTCHDIEVIDTFTKTLAAVALASRRFNLIATPILYSRYDVQQGQPFLQSFCHTISARPDLAQNLKSISIVNCRPIDVYEPIEFDPIKLCARRQRREIRSQILERCASYGQRWIRALFTDPSLWKWEPYEVTTVAIPRNDPDYSPRWVCTAHLEIALLLLNARNVERIELSFTADKKSRKLCQDFEEKEKEEEEEEETQPLVCSRSEDEWYWSHAFCEPLLQAAESILSTPGPPKHFANLRSLRLNLVDVRNQRIAYLFLLPQLQELEFDSLEFDAHPGVDWERDLGYEHTEWPIKPRSSSVQKLRFRNSDFNSVEELLKYTNSCRVLLEFEFSGRAFDFQQTDWQYMQELIPGLLSHSATLSALILSLCGDEELTTISSDLHQLHVLKSLTLTCPLLISRSAEHEVVSLGAYLPQSLQHLELVITWCQVTTIREGRENFVDKSSELSPTPYSYLPPLFVTDIKSVCVRYSGGVCPRSLLREVHSDFARNGIEFEFSVSLAKPSTEYVISALNLLEQQGFSQEDAFGHIVVQDDDCFINIRDWIKTRTKDSMIEEKKRIIAAAWEKLLDY